MIVSFPFYFSPSSYLPFDTPRLEVYRFIILELYTLKMKNIDELS